METCTQIYNHAQVHTRAFMHTRTHTLKKERKQKKYRALLRAGAKDWSSSLCPSLCQNLTEAQSVSPDRSPCQLLWSHLLEWDI